MEEEFNCKCPKCGNGFFLKDHGYYKCEDCGTYFYFPDDMRLCPYCRAEIYAAALKCSHCGEWINKNAQNYDKRPTYLMLSFLLGNLGAGEFYIGRYGTGVAYLILTCLFAYYSPIACIAIWIIAMLDALLSDFGLPPEKAKLRKKLRIGFFAFIVVGLLAWGVVIKVFNY